MEEAAELANYLPLSFKTPKEQEYIEFLWDAFETNYKHGKYQFAFLAYHMLTMSFVYFNDHPLYVQIALCRAHPSGVVRRRRESLPALRIGAKQAHLSCWQSQELLLLASEGEVYASYELHAVLGSAVVRD